MNRTMKWFLLGCMVSACLALCACSPATSNVVGEIGQIVLGIIPIAAASASVLLPGEAAAITAGATLAGNGINEVKQLVHDYHANPSDAALAKLTAGTNDVHVNLRQLMAAAQVKDYATQTKLTAIVNAAQQSLAAVEASINAGHSTAVAATADTGA